jgi:hypothetical protein
MSVSIAWWRYFILVSCCARATKKMNQPLFDLEHLRIAAELRAKAWRKRWLNIAGELLVLLIVSLGVMVTVVVLAQIVLNVRGLMQ